MRRACTTGWVVSSRSRRSCDKFSDEVVKNCVAGQDSENPELREWHREKLARLPGLKFMRTLWLCEVAGGPFQFSPTHPGRTHLGLEEAHRDLQIDLEEFDAVAGELGRTLDAFKVPAKEKDEVLSAFAAHKGEVTEGATAAAGVEVRRLLVRRLQEGPTVCEADDRHRLDRVPALNVDDDRVISAGLRPAGALVARVRKANRARQQSAAD